MALGTIDVRLIGPLLTGAPAATIDAYLKDATWQVGSQLLSEWHQNLDRSIRNPTPYYETQIMVERVRRDVVVHDRGIIYGPWLEGTSSRNQTTRFKGYASLRRALQQLQRSGRVEQILQVVLRPYLARLGGGS